MPRPLKNLEELKELIRETKNDFSIEDWMEFIQWLLDEHEYCRDCGELKKQCGHFNMCIHAE